MSAQALEDLDDFYRRCSSTLRSEDGELANLLGHEYLRQNNSLVMVAAAGLMDPSVMACTGSVLENITSEGYPGCRFHGGSEIVDRIERLAIARAINSLWRAICKRSAALRNFGQSCSNDVAAGAWRQASRP
ncbi:hypothetical protein [Bradyrhizobium sp. BR 1432]|uniref:hypothetical protein n=1 Tax=Bradyrhizobium sp. BR 1432 TaxID=3447966 RepID=UPI003EE5B85B